MSISTRFDTVKTYVSNAANATGRKLASAGRTSYEFAGKHKVLTAGVALGTIAAGVYVGRKLNKEA